MKKVFLILAAITMMLASCMSPSKLIQKGQEVMEKYCDSTRIKNPLTGDVDIHYECDSLWKTAKIKSKCPTANICIDVANGKISGDVKCPGVIPSPNIAP